MCLKLAFFWGSYDDGTLFIASARLASATYDTWEVAAVGCRPDDDVKGLLRFGRLPTEADCRPGFALPNAGPTPAVFTDPWLGLGTRFSLDTERGLAKALWASNLPRMMDKSWRRELTFVHSRFPTVGDLSRSLYSPLLIFASTCLISPLYSMGSRLSKKCKSMKEIYFDGRMRVKWYTSLGLIRIPEVMHLTWIKSSSRNSTSFTCSAFVSIKNILFFLNLKQNWMSWVKGIMERLHASTPLGLQTSRTCHIEASDPSRLCHQYTCRS